MVQIYVHLVIVMVIGESLLTSVFTFVLINVRVWAEKTSRWT